MRIVLQMDYLWRGVKLWSMYNVVMPFTIGYQGDSLSGALGGTRLGGKEQNIKFPGRYDPNKPPNQQPNQCAPNRGMRRGLLLPLQQQ